MLSNTGNTQGDPDEEALRLGRIPAFHVAAPIFHPQACGRQLCG
jgi:hypothetical protein